MADQSSTESFDRERHIRYFAHSLKSLPSAYAHLDTNRLTLVHFAVHSLDLMGVLDDDATLQKVGIDKEGIVEWIYSLQILPSAAEDDEGSNKSNSKWNNHGGFKGGTFLGGPGAQYRDDGAEEGMKRQYECLPYHGFEYDHGHVAMTYTALCTLVALGDDLSRFDKRSAIKSLKSLQRDDGRCVDYW